MLDLQELKRLAELPGDIGRTELAFWMADHAHEFIAEVESLRRQLEEAKGEIAKDELWYEELRKELLALRSSRDADIERAIRLTFERLQGLIPYAIHVDIGVAEVLAQVKEQGNG